MFDSLTSEELSLPPKLLEIARTPGWLAQTPPDYLLTYNEPDNASQATVPTITVVAMPIRTVFPEIFIVNL